MDIIQTPAATSLIRLYERGVQLNWLGVAGDSISRWLTTPELMTMEKDLDLDSTQFIPLNLREPTLARECFMYCCHGDSRHLDSTHSGQVSIKILQVNPDGTKCRVLWEYGEPNRSPLEISLHLTSHGAHSVGTGCVVYHCQPLNTMALTELLDEETDDLLPELVKCSKPVINMLPDGIGIIPWGMPQPLRPHERMTQEMYQCMENFMLQVAEHIRYQEAVVLRGEGLICASRGEREVYNIIQVIERAASIRLKILAAGGK